MVYDTPASIIMQRIEEALGEVLAKAAEGKRKKVKVDGVTIATNGAYRLEVTRRFRGRRVCLVSIVFEAEKVEKAPDKRSDRARMNVRNTKIRDWSEAAAQYLTSKGYNTSFTVKDYVQAVINIWITKDS